jgi:hypothetical protein
VIENLEYQEELRQDVLSKSNKNRKENHDLRIVKEGNEEEKT